MMKNEENGALKTEEKGQEDSARKLLVVEVNLVSQTKTDLAIANAPKEDASTVTEKAASSSDDSGLTETENLKLQWDEEDIHSVHSDQSKFAFSDIIAETLAKSIVKTSFRSACLVIEANVVQFVGVKGKFNRASSQEGSPVQSRKSDLDFQLDDERGEAVVLLEEETPDAQTPVANTETQPQSSSPDCLSSPPHKGDDQWEEKEKEEGVGAADLCGGEADPEPSEAARAEPLDVSEAIVVNAAGPSEVPPPDSDMAIVGPQVDEPEQPRPEPQVPESGKIGSVEVGTVLLRTRAGPEGDVHITSVATRSLTFELRHPDAIVLSVMMNAAISVMKHVPPEEHSAARIRDSKGWSPLHHAASRGMQAVCEFLIDCGYSPHAVTDSGEDCVALSKKYPSLSAWLGSLKDVDASPTVPQASATQNVQAQSDEIVSRHSGAEEGDSSDMSGADPDYGDDERISGSSSKGDEREETSSQLSDKGEDDFRFDFSETPPPEESVADPDEPAPSSSPSDVPRDDGQTLETLATKDLNSSPRGESLAEEAAMAATGEAPGVMVFPTVTDGPESSGDLTEERARALEKIEPDSGTQTALEVDETEFAVKSATRSGSRRREPLLDVGTVTYVTAPAWLVGTSFDWNEKHREGAPSGTLARAQTSGDSSFAVESLDGESTDGVWKQSVVVGADRSMGKFSLTWQPKDQDLTTFRGAVGAVYRQAEDMSVAASSPSNDTMNEKEDGGSECSEEKSVPSEASGSHLKKLRSATRFIGHSATFKKTGSFSRKKSMMSMTSHMTADFEEMRRDVAEDVGNTSNAITTRLEFLAWLKALQLRSLKSRAAAGHLKQAAEVGKLFTHRLRLPDMTQMLLHAHPPGSDDVQIDEALWILQTSARRVLAQQIYQAETAARETAVLSVQRVYRGHTDRTFVRGVRYRNNPGSAAVRLQSVFRAHCARQSFKKENNVSFHFVQKKAHQGNLFASSIFRFQSETPRRANPRNEIASEFDVWLGLQPDDRDLLVSVMRSAAGRRRLVFELIETERYSLKESSRIANNLSPWCTGEVHGYGRHNHLNHIDAVETEIGLFERCFRANYIGDTHLIEPPCLNFQNMYPTSRTRRRNLVNTMKRRLVPRGEHTSYFRRELHALNLKSHTAAMKHTALSVELASLIGAITATPPSVVESAFVSPYSLPMDRIPRPSPRQLRTAPAKSMRYPAAPQSSPRHPPTPTPPPTTRSNSRAELRRIDGREEEAEAVPTTGVIAPLPALGRPLRPALPRSNNTPVPPSRPPPTPPSEPVAGSRPQSWRGRRSVFSLHPHAPLSQHNDNMQVAPAPSRTIDPAEDDGDQKQRGGGDMGDDNDRQPERSAAVAVSPPPFLSPSLTKTLFSALAHPVACGQCGEALPFESVSPHVCPACHEPVRIIGPRAKPLRLASKNYSPPRSKKKREEETLLPQIASAPIPPAQIYNEYVNRSRRSGSPSSIAVRLARRGVSVAPKTSPQKQSEAFSATNRGLSPKPIFEAKPRREPESWDSGFVRRSRGTPRGRFIVSAPPGRVSSGLEGEESDREWKFKDEDDEFEVHENESDFRLRDVQIQTANLSDKASWPPRCDAAELDPLLGKIPTTPIPGIANFSLRSKEHKGVSELQDPMEHILPVKEHGAKEVVSALCSALTRSTGPGRVFGMSVVRGACVNVAATMIQSAWKGHAARVLFEMEGRESMIYSRTVSRKIKRSA